MDSILTEIWLNNERFAKLYYYTQKRNYCHPNDLSICKIGELDCLYFTDIAFNQSPQPLTQNTHLLNIPAPSHNETDPLLEASLESIAYSHRHRSRNLCIYGSIGLRYRPQRLNSCR